MTKEEIESALEKLNAYRNILLASLKEFESKEDLEPPTESDAFDIKQKLYHAINSGRLTKTLERLSDRMDIAKTVIKSLSDIIKKTQDKLEERAQSSGPTDVAAMTDKWIPMYISLLQTQEFQLLLSNMLVELLKDNK